MNALVARQPIFDKNKTVVAYELLFRNKAGSCYDGVDGDEATNNVIVTSFFSIGMDVVTGGKKAFINFTSNLLKAQVPQLLPPQSIVVEILETVEPDPEIIAACCKLKEMGYILALDDFVFHPRFMPLIELADIIKVDFLATPPAERRMLAEQGGALGIKFLAEKVETMEEFQEAVDAGYTYFQGYFFSKPIVLTRRDIPAAKLSYLRLLQELNEAQMDVVRIEDIIKREVSFSYRLLKYINSAVFGFKQEIRSLRQAIVLLGQRDLLKWVSLNAMHHSVEDKSPELLATAVIRAHFGELVAKRLNKQNVAADMFLLGLFSLIDAILDCRLEDILHELPISGSIKSALLGEKGLLYDIHRLTLSYERGDWLVMVEYAQKLGIAEYEMPELYLEALLWAKELSDLSKT